MKRYLLCIYQPQGGLPQRPSSWKKADAIWTPSIAVSKSAAAWIFAGGLKPLKALPR